MPETKKYDRKQIDTPHIDWDNFAYRDKKREKQRREAMA